MLRCPYIHLYQLIAFFVNVGLLSGLLGPDIKGAFMAIEPMLEILKSMRWPEEPRQFNNGSWQVERYAGVNLPVEINVMRTNDGKFSQLEARVQVGDDFRQLLFVHNHDWMMQVSGDAGQVYVLYPSKVDYAPQLNEWVTDTLLTAGVLPPVELRPAVSKEQHLKEMSGLVLNGREENGKKEVRWRNGENELGIDKSDGQLRLNDRGSHRHVLVLPWSLWEGAREELRPLVGEHFATLGEHETLALPVLDEVWSGAELPRL